VAGEPTVPLDLRREAVVRGHRAGIHDRERLPDRNADSQPLRALLDLGVTCGQGFLLARPAPLPLGRVARGNGSGQRAAAGAL
jgi:hypothetical protein